jgi:hypothetical protein
MVYRVIQYATGVCGRAAVRAVADHPDLELVGARVYDPAKVGRDIGEICGIGPLGVLATGRDEDLLAIDADCVLWMGAASWMSDPEAARRGILDLCRILASGKNLITIVHAPFVHPGTLPPEVRQPLERACEQGKTSLHMSGIDPGFASEVLSLTASGLCRRIDELRVQEILDYSEYDNAQIMFDVMGFGKPPDTATAFTAGTMLSAYAGSLHLVAEGLGVKIDEIRPELEVKLAKESFDIAAGHVPAGTISAMRFAFRAIVAGQPRLVVEHVTRLNRDQAPEWPQGHGYTVTLRGDPSMRLSFEMGFGEGRSELADSVLCAAMHAVNSIPAVCAAAPGIRTFLELPLITGRHTLARD